MEDRTIDLFLVDDHQLVLEGLAALLAREPQFRVVGQSDDPLAAPGKVEETRPHVILLDVTMPGMNGLDLCRELTRRFKGLAVLMLTMHDDQEFVARAVTCGASGYVVKGASAKELSQAIRAVARGRLHLPQGLSRDFPDQIRQDDPYDLLTAREKQILLMIAQVRSSRRIAEELGLAVKTVDAHRARLMRKLDLHKVGDVVKYAIHRGLVPRP
jgi:DNA-binding NarL/FixJ family response regulator